jgi:hypothetical protein
MQWTRMGVWIVIGTTKTEATLAWLSVDDGGEGKTGNERGKPENESGLASPLKSGRGMSDTVVESELEQLQVNSRAG